MPETPTAPVVFVVDDDLAVRTAMGRLLRASGYGVHEFESAIAFLDGRPPLHGPSCLVLDVRMPGMSGLQAQSVLHDLRDVLPIIFITGHGDIPMSVQAVRAGAEDFLAKPVSSEQLLPAIERALERSRAARVAGQVTGDINARLASLTPKEREVCALVVRGLLNKQIADVLSISEQTVKVHRGRILQKFGVRSAVEVAAMLASVARQG